MRLIVAVSCFALALAVAAGARVFAASDAPAGPVHTFDTDPHWEVFGKFAKGAPARHVVQDFGWRPTNKAGGKAPGEIGGTVSRSLTRAVYWMKIAPKTLEDKLTVSGRFAVPHTDNDSGMQFGFFNETSTGWRTPNSFVFRLSGEDKKDRGQYSWALVDLGNRSWKTSGQGAFDGAYQHTKTPPIRSDGQSHEFAINYDPAGAAGEGELSITIDGHTWKTPLEKGVKADGALFNRFGLMNLQSSGNAMEVYLDDIRVNGELLDFTQDPGWEGIGNHADFQDRDIRPWDDFRWSDTAHAGGQPGEMGVTMWRDDAPVYFATDAGKLTMDQPLHAEGRLAFVSAGSDSALYFGWFNAQAKQNCIKTTSTAHQKDFIAVLMAGPSRIGHYFCPAYATSGADGRAAEVGPIIKPDGRVHHWALDYDPAANDGKGRIVSTLDGQTCALDLPAGARAQGATFDRFGFFNQQEGGHYVKVFIDDLRFTSGKDQPQKQGS